MVSIKTDGDKGLSVMVTATKDCRSWCRSKDFDHGTTSIMGLSVMGRLKRQKRQGLSVVVTVGLIVARPAAAAPPETRAGGSGVEIGLGVLLTGAAAGMIAFGVVQLVRAQEQLEFCRRGVTVIDELGGGGIDLCAVDPPELGFASAGLSFGLSVPLLVGGGVLLARGGRSLRTGRHTEVGAWGGRGTAGAMVLVRF